MPIPSEEELNNTIVRGSYSLVFLAIITLLGAGIILTLLAVVVSSLLSMRESARNMQCVSNLKNQIMAVSSYADYYKTFMPSVVPADKSLRLLGKDAPAFPENLTSAPVSWRKEIVESLSDDTTIRVPGFYICPDSYDENISGSFTSYMYVTGEKCISHSEQAILPADISKGLQYTLAICEVIHSKTAWDTPGDLPYARFCQGINLADNQLCAGGNHQEKGVRKLNGAFCDGSVRGINADINPEIWQDMPIVSKTETSQP